MTDYFQIHPLIKTSNASASATTGTTTFVDGTAAYSAHYQRLVVEEELSVAGPDGGVRHVLIGATTEDNVAYELRVPADRDERREWCYEVAADLAEEVPVAAAMSCPCVDDNTGRETVAVFASDRCGGHEAWAAEVLRAPGAAPLIGEWEQVALGGEFVFMLHIAVANFAGMRDQAETEGVPPRFFPGIQPLPINE